MVTKVFHACSDSSIAPMSYETQSIKFLVTSAGATLKKQCLRILLSRLIVIPERYRNRIANRNTTIQARKILSLR